MSGAVKQHPEDRFYQKTELASRPSSLSVSTPCLEWTGYRVATGYGQFWADGRRQSAHRWIFQHQNGIIAEGLEVRHKCDNPRCVRVDHLELGSRQDNVDDMMERNRRASTKGTQNGRSKLSEEQVREIRRHLAEKQLSTRKIARMYSVSQGVVSNIKHRRIWEWLD